MAGVLGSIAKSYVASKIGGSAAGSLMGQDSGGGGTQQDIGQVLGNLAASSSGDTLSPHQFSMPSGGVQFFNRQREQQKKRIF